MTENFSIQRPSGKPIDKWIPWFFVVFFVIIAALDAVFVTLALTTHTGTVTDKAYERGLAYNATLEEAAAVTALGWSGNITFEAAGEGDAVVMTLADIDGKPIDGADVIVKITRPVQEGHDFDTVMEDQGGGFYRAPVIFPLPGQWKVRVFATWQGMQFQTAKTIIVQR